MVEKLLYTYYVPGWAPICLHFLIKILYGPRRLFAEPIFIEKRLVHCLYLVWRWKSPLISNNRLQNFETVFNLKAIFAPLPAAKATMVAISNLWCDFLAFLPIFFSEIFQFWVQRLHFWPKNSSKCQKRPMTMPMGSVPLGLGPHLCHGRIGWPKTIFKLKILKKVIK